MSHSGLLKVLSFLMFEIFEIKMFKKIFFRARHFKIWSFNKNFKFFPDLKILRYPASKFMMCEAFEVFGI